MFHHKTGSLQSKATSKGLVLYGLSTLVVKWFSYKSGSALTISTVLTAILDNRNVLEKDEGKIRQKKIL